MMLTLAEMQSMVQRSIMEKSEAILPHISNPSRGDKAKAFGVYQFAYGSRLTEFLANDYEKLRSYVGEVRFNAMAQAYVAAHPSRQANARWFGQGLPKFLKQSNHFAQFPECVELAELELALATAFDAVDVTSLGMDALATLPPESIASTGFAFHPSLQTLQFMHSTVSLWSALQCDEAPPRPHALDEPQTVMVWRQGGQSRFRILGDEEAMALANARDGVPFGALCEMMAFSHGADDVALRAATYLRGWLEAEILTSFRL
jgi:Putative DNA-binding domain